MTLETSTIGRLRAALRTPVRLGLLMAALAVVALSSAASPVDANDEADLAIYRVTVEDDAQIQTLIDEGYDLLEIREGDDLFVVAGPDEVTALRADGYAVTLDQALPFLGGSGDDFSIEEYFGGYRSWDEHVDHLRAVAASNPGLAQVVDYGDSWRKVNGRAGGNDLLAICLTNRQPGDCDLRPDAAKPRAVIMAAIHARELVPAEVAYRLIDDLVAGYGTDAEITAILDTTEVWIIPVANPDGREIVELGGNAPYLQRKNANDTIGNCRRPPSASNQHGVDLNRNADYGWGGPGTSTNPCAQTYRGTAGASEPEQQALEALFADLWPSRPTAPGVPVPDSTTGTFITIHSYSDLILLPPGSGPLTPDDADLRALAFRMSDTNRYRVGTPPELLYSVSGSTDDWVYGRLGVASFTYEIGPSGGSCGGFTPPYRCVDADLYPRNRDALLYSLRVAGGPYTLPSGPTPDRPTVPGGTVSGTITVSAVFDDDAFGPASGSRGRPSAQDIVAAEVYVGAGPWEGGTPAAMAPTDGTFDSVREAATAQVSVDGLPAGQHPIYVRARDAAGDWGPVGAAFVTVEGAPTPTQGSISGTVVGDGGGRAGVAIDLFTADAGGSRGVYVATRTTGGDGTYTFDPIDPGCWVLTFIAPPGETFVGDDGWLGPVRLRRTRPGGRRGRRRTGDGRAVGPDPGRGTRRLGRGRRCRRRPVRGRRRRQPRGLATNGPDRRRRAVHPRLDPGVLRPHLHRADRSHVHQRESVVQLVGLRRRR